MTVILTSCVCPRGTALAGTTVLIPKESNCMSAPVSGIDITLDIMPGRRKAKPPIKVMTNVTCAASILMMLNAPSRNLPLGIYNNNNNNNNNNWT